MEYVADHGTWSDFPFDRVAKDFSDYYPESFFENAARDDVNRKFEEERSLA